MSTPRKQKKERTIVSFSITIEDKERISELCDQLGLTQSGFMYSAVKSKINDHKDLL